MTKDAIIISQAELIAEIIKDRDIYKMLYENAIKSEMGKNG